MQEDTDNVIDTASTQPALFFVVGQAARSLNIVYLERISAVHDACPEEVDGNHHEP
jgi:hypothetical protein